MIYSCTGNFYPADKIGIYGIRLFVFFLNAVRENRVSVIVLGHVKLRICKACYFRRLFFALYYINTVFHTEGSGDYQNNN